MKSKRQKRKIMTRVTSKKKRMKKKRRLIQKSQRHLTDRAVVGAPGMHGKEGNRISKT
jgi:hypothetical protein